MSFDQSPSERRAAATFWAAAIAIGLLSLPFRLNGVAPNVSWLVFVCERMIDGAAVYVDLIESAVPLSVLLYFPAALAGRLSGLDPDMVAVALAYAAAFGCIALARSILPRTAPGVGPTDWTILAPCLVVLFIVADHSFAEREFFAAAFTLPIVSIYIRNAADGSWPGALKRMPAGLLGGVAAALKPPIFALPFLAVGFAAVLRRRNLQAIFKGGLAEAAIASAAATAWSLWLMPEYVNATLPLMNELYLAVRLPPIILVKVASFLGVAVMLALTSIAIARSRSATALPYLLAASIGYLAAYVIQGKYWEYHLLPAAMFAVACILGAGASMSHGASSALKGEPIFAVLYGGFALYALASVVYANIDRTDRMRDLRWAGRLDRPTVAGIAPYMSTTFPLVRQFRGRWIDPYHSQWRIVYGKLGLALYGNDDEKAARFRRAINAEYERVIRLIREQRPEILIIDASGGDKALYKDALARAPDLLADYSVVAEESNWRILERGHDAAEIAK